MDDLQATLQNLLENPEELNRIAQSAASIFQDASENQTQEEGLDLAQLSKLFHKMDGGSSRKLVKALEPFLSDERRGKLERASRIAHLSSFAEVLFGKGEEHD